MSAGGVYLEIVDIDDSQLRVNSIKYYKSTRLGVQQEPWGCVSIVIDPFHNRLTLNLVRGEIADD